MSLIKTNKETKKTVEKVKATFVIVFNKFELDLFTKVYSLEL